MKRKLIRLNQPVRNLDGASNPAVTLGNQAAAYLARGQGVSGHHAMKLWDWAQGFFRGDEFTLDAADLQFLRGFIDGNGEMPAWLKTQVLLALEAAPEAGPTDQA